MRNRGDQVTDEEHSKLDALYEAFMVPPSGKKTSFIEDLRAVSEAYQRGSWVAKAGLWLLPTLAGLAIAWDRLVAFLTKG